MRFTSARVQLTVAYLSAALAWATFAYMGVAPTREDRDDWAYIRPEGGYAIALSPLVLAFATAGFLLAAYASPVRKLALAVNLAAYVSVLAFWIVPWLLG